jgi:hypothetical protein
MGQELYTEEGKEGERMSCILAIDPGPAESAYVLLGEDLKPLEFGKLENENIKSQIQRLLRLHNIVGESIAVAIEMVASYGMPVGAEVFETCVWVGRFVEIAEEIGSLTQFIYRKEVKMNLCGSLKAKDGNIRQALIDRFGVVGTKKNPGGFTEYKRCMECISPSE